MARVPLEPAAMDRPRNCAPPCGKILARCVAAIEGRELQVRPMVYSEAYKRIVTLLLMAAYTFNSMDRSIVSIIASPMKLDLKLTDTELGLLGGTAFAVLYALGGVPLARLAERVNRVGIITAALIVWSGLTALCGAARTFPQLLLIRAGVGVAEAGCSPPAHSLISDYYEPSRRTSALSIYTCGISLGYILAAVVGGYVAQHFGWRIACTTVGLPGVATAVLIKIFVREPPRGYSDASPPATGGAPFSLRGEWRELRAVGKALLLDRPILHMVTGRQPSARLQRTDFTPSCPRTSAAPSAWALPPSGSSPPFQAAWRSASAFSPVDSSPILSPAAARGGMPWFRRSAARSRCPCICSRCSRRIGRGRPGLERRGILSICLARS